MKFFVNLLIYRLRFDLLVFASNFTASSQVEISIGCTGSSTRFPAMQGRVLIWATPME